MIGGAHALWKGRSYGASLPNSGRRQRAAFLFAGSGVTLHPSDPPGAVRMSEGISVERVDHIGIRVRDLDRALAFYEVLGFRLVHKVTFDAVAIIKNRTGIEINLVINANAGDPAKNILMDVPEKYAGYTHVALRVASIADTLTALKAHDVRITQGPVK